MGEGRKQGRSAILKITELLPETRTGDGFRPIPGNPGGKSELKENGGFWFSYYTLQV